MTTIQNSPSTLLRAARQQQFLDVIDRDEAEARFWKHLTLSPLGEESVPLTEALGRVLSRDVISDVDVPGFDRSRVDGFALRSADTAGATDEEPRTLKLNSEILTPGIVPTTSVVEGSATIVATGGMIPRGADAVVMVEHTDAREKLGHVEVDVNRTVSPGAFIAR